MENTDVIILDVDGKRVDENGIRIDEHIIDRALIQIKQKEIDEQSRSNKVVEGIFKDICGGIYFLAESIDLHKNINIERDIMNDKGNELAGQGSDIAENKKINYSFEELADIITVMKKDNTELVFISNHLRLMNESLQLIAEQVSSQNIRLQRVSKIVLTIAEADSKAEVKDDSEKAKPVSPEKEKPETKEPVTLIHMAHPTYGIKYSMCGSLGTPSQPYTAGKSTEITGNKFKVNCPECLPIIESK